MLRPTVGHTLYRAAAAPAEPMFAMTRRCLARAPSLFSANRQLRMETKGLCQAYFGLRYRAVEFTIVPDPGLDALGAAHSAV
ncbi:hypothetical protein HBH98_182830 [Parastagonospora nodorum]|nr:hypothetical protein HBH53_230920 [Parastagonospora nodorum]KAH3956680.1 hypothetical protein HBH51_237310 [Parastagonospora nodorum]KAH4215700.1 hypothetical protein HBI06_244080 [Parastagonospora nodorum]KAH4224452.1 hypothetical protein HBI05_236330 [Parastagonospora nodorum]KAH4341271.1 hypothetical protein HBH98_182830 [Parastagonospora nodorum]